MELTKEEQAAIKTLERLGKRCYLLRVVHSKFTNYYPLVKSKSIPMVV